MPPLTNRRLKELLNYDPETGIFVWKINKANIFAGTVAGRNRPDGYIVITIDKKKYYAHRLAFLYMEGYIPENMVDHIDRNPSNNKWDNLREVRMTCNAHNCNLSKRNKSGINGVRWKNSRNKWIADIRANDKNIYLGYFNTKLDAAKARWEAEKKYGYTTCNPNSFAYEYIKSKERKPISEMQDK